MKLRPSHIRFVLVLATFAAASIHSAAHAQQRAEPAPPRRECAMAGLWSSGPGAWVTDYSADGRWHTYTTLADARRNSPVRSGTFVAEGNAIRFLDQAEPQSQGYLYRVTVTGNACETLHLVLVQSDTPSQQGFTINFSRVLQDQQ